MQSLRFTITINAAKERVWKTMLEDATYRQWTKPFSANSQYAGDWIEGSSMRFFDPDMGGGMKANVEIVQPYERVLLRYVALTGADGTEDAQSEEALKWVGIHEEYRFREAGASTELTVDLETPADFADEFSAMWPKALDLLKALCEERR